jgi:hypothetical protein
MWTQWRRSDFNRGAEAMDKPNCHCFREHPEQTNVDVMAIACQQVLSFRIAVQAAGLCEATMPLVTITMVAILMKALASDLTQTVDVNSPVLLAKFEELLATLPEQVRMRDAEISVATTTVEERGTLQ